MKRVIDGKSYNTGTATPLCEVRLHGYPYKRSGYQKTVDMGTLGPGMKGSNWRENVGIARLYQTVAGAYFLVIEIMDGYDVHGLEPGLYPLTRTEALAWAEEHFDADKIESLFGSIEEAGSESAAVLVRIPPVVRRQIEASAGAAKQSVNQFMLRCLEGCAATARYPDDDFEINLEKRIAKHRPSGISFSFYDYTSDHDWQQAAPSNYRDNPDWDGDRMLLIIAAKRAAVAKGMKYARPSKTARTTD